MLYLWGWCYAIADHPLPFQYFSLPAVQLLPSHTFVGFVVHPLPVQYFVGAPITTGASAVSMENSHATSPSTPGKVPRSWYCVKSVAVIVLMVPLLPRCTPWDVSYEVISDTLPELPLSPSTTPSSETISSSGMINYSVVNTGRTTTLSAIDDGVYL